jgi:hypothetical protein
MQYCLSYKASILHDEGVFYVCVYVLGTWVQDERPAKPPYGTNARCLKPSDCVCGGTTVIQLYPWVKLTCVVQ